MMAWSAPYPSYGPQHGHPPPWSIPNAYPSKTSQHHPQYFDRANSNQTFYQPNTMPPNQARYQNNVQHLPLIPPSSSLTSEDLRHQQNVMTEMNKALLTITSRYQEYNKILPNFVQQGALPLPPLCASCTRGVPPADASQQTASNSLKDSNSASSSTNERNAAEMWRKKYESLKGQLWRIHASMDTLQQNLQVAYEERKALDIRCELAETEARDLREQHDNLQQEQNLLHTSISDVKEHENSFASLLRSQSDFRDNMSNALKYLRSDVYEDREHLSKLQERCAERRAETDQFKRSIRHLQASCSSTTSNLEQLYSDFDQFATTGELNSQDSATQTDLSESDPAESIKPTYTDEGTQTTLRECTKSYQKGTQTPIVSNHSIGSQTTLFMAETLSESPQTHNSQNPGVMKRSQITVIADTMPVEDPRVSRNTSDAGDVARSPESNRSSSTKKQAYSGLNLDSCQDESDKVMTLHACARDAIDECQVVTNKFNRQTWSARDLLLECFDMLMPKNGEFNIETVAQQIGGNGRISAEHAVRMLHDIPDLVRTLNGRVEISEDSDTVVDPIEAIEPPQSRRSSVWEMPDEDAISEPPTPHRRKTGAGRGLKRKGIATVWHKGDRPTKRVKS